MFVCFNPCKKRFSKSKALLQFQQDVRMSFVDNCPQSHAVCVTHAEMIEIAMAYTVRTLLLMIGSYYNCVEKINFRFVFPCIRICVFLCISLILFRNAIEMCSLTK